MNTKKMIFINTILTFSLCFLTHFLYEWFPNPLFSLFFPVNESIWEHMKMIYTTILLYGIIEYFLCKLWKIDTNNFLLTILVKSIIAIPLFLLFYLPIYYNFGENMLITFIILFITILLVNIMGYFIYKSKKIPYQNIFSMVIILLLYIGFGILTYKPIKCDLFFDTQKEKYGIDDYINKD